MFTIFENTKLAYKSVRDIGKVLGAPVVKGKPNKILLYGDQVDKLKQYAYFHANGIPSLEYTTKLDIVKTWLDLGHVVFGRKLLNSKEGNGIVVINPGDDIPNCPVYTRYAKKKKEFRVHVFKDKVVSVLEKRRKSGLSTKPDSKIRNTANGYVFCRQNVVEPQGIKELALQARQVTTSDFVGVDIGFNEKLNQCFVIEVNSAPGIQNSTVNDYVKAIKEFYNV